MSETQTKERFQIVNEALRENRLAILCGINGPGVFRAVCVRGEPNAPAAGPYLVDGKSITAEAPTQESAVTACEDLVMAHLSVVTAPLSGDDELRAEMAAMKAELAAMRAATAPAPAAPTKPPKPGKPEPASL